MKVNVKYNGSTISQLTELGGVVCETKNKVLSDNIYVEVEDDGANVPVNPEDTTDLTMWIITE